jgi:signal transduction histidine kinase
LLFGRSGHEPRRSVPSLPGATGLRRLDRGRRPGGRLRGRAARAHLPALVDDFYAEIERHPDARKVITGGAAQVERLKTTLARWLRELLCGCYDREYVTRRWRVGWRHVEIGLDQVYTNVALSRLRTGVIRTLQEHWTGDSHQLQSIVRALNQLLDLDLALIEDAYQAEYMARLQRSERLAAKERSEAAFRTLIEAAPCLIVILRPDHSVAYFSRFAEGLTGYADSEVLGKDFDPFRLEQVFRNILENALAACRDPALVTVRCAEVTLDGAPAVRVSVADNGPGLSAEARARIFEPFYTTKTKGTGLGMAIAQRIVQAHAGQIAVASAPPRGAEILVTLPRKTP